MKRFGVFIWMAFCFLFGGLLLAAGAGEALKALASLALQLAHHTASDVAGGLGSLTGAILVVALGYWLAFKKGPQAYDFVKRLGPQAAEQ